MALATWLSISPLVASTICITLFCQKSFAFDEPQLFASAVVGLSGLAILLFERLRLYAVRKSSGKEDEQISLDKEPVERKARYLEAKPQTILKWHSFTASTHLSFKLPIALVVALYMRTEIFRLNLRHIECAHDSFEPGICIFIALYDYLTTRRQQSIQSSTLRAGSTRASLSSTLVQPRNVRLILSLTLSSGCWFLLRSTVPIRSTYICAQSLPFTHLIPISQLCGVLLDWLISMAVYELLGLGVHKSSCKLNEKRHLLGSVLIISASFSTLITFLSSHFRGAYRPSVTFISAQFWSSLPLVLAASIAFLSAVETAQYIGIVATTAIVLSSCTYVLALSRAWANNLFYAPGSPLKVTVIVLLVAWTLAALLYLGRGSESRPRTPKQMIMRKPAILYILFALISALPFLLFHLNGNVLDHHPVDSLIREAKEHHENWFRQASTSVRFTDAVKEYRRRYSRSPPQNFNHWFEYATSRSVVVKDDFDSIDRDLRPFWSLSPAEIRNRTWEMLSNPWNDVGGISIRNGEAKIMPNVVPTHLWMLEGVATLIGQFSTWLPDMDLAFNLNDEPRVAVPYDTMMQMTKIADKKGNGSVQDMVYNFSSTRQWRDITEQQLQHTRFEENSLRRIFYQFGSVACSPKSKSRTERIWNVRDFCASCAEPHSRGLFISSWPLAADVCHQPDLANLHGFYLSPAAFKATHELMPVFSQSKAHGFNDILYPSAWNYMDKAMYEPSAESLDLPFREKKSALFWRGATSEGVSAGYQTWQGMTRQRLVHLGKNFTSSSAEELLLLPYPLANSHEKSFAYATIPRTDLSKLLDVDVAIVDRIARCVGQDCDEQAKEFGLQPPSNFQAHWKYRYLFDADGAGFSGRFLPFLQSRSLPFKSALFREWYDDRITAWYHFVPQDLRLHGLFSTLAYFAGLDGTIKGKTVKWRGREGEAENIAEEGRKWAATALRKEDMEAYFFRLLLEWGRLTDDARDERDFS